MIHAITLMVAALAAVGSTAGARTQGAIADLRLQLANIDALTTASGRP